MTRSELKRKTPLRSDPAKAREFEQRGRGGLKQDPAKTRAWVAKARRLGLSTDPIKLEEFQRRARKSMSGKAVRSARRGAARRGEGPLSPGDWREAVAIAADLHCMVSGARAYDAFDPVFDAHHPLPKRELRARGLHAHVYDPRNGVFVAEQVHLDHEGAVKRISREVLPASVWEFCEEMDALGAGEWATAMVERQHPAAGSQPRSRSRRA